MKDAINVTLGAVLALFVIWWTHVPEEAEKPFTGLQEAYDRGYVAGKRDALNVRHVSEDLENACMGLWFGKEGPIYWKNTVKDQYEKHTQSY